MSSIASGFPDWQRITQWFGSPLKQATGYAIGAGQKIEGPLDVRNFASIVVCVKPTGGSVTVTVTQAVPGGPASLQTASSFVVNAGNVLFEAFVLLAGAVTVTFQGSAGGETLDYAIVPSNTNMNAEVAALTQLGFQHNDAVVANETAIDLEDTIGVTWQMTDDPANLRMKIAATAKPGWQHNGAVVANEPSLSMVDNADFLFAVADDAGSSRVTASITAKTTDSGTWVDSGNRDFNPFATGGGLYFAEVTFSGQVMAWAIVGVAISSADGVSMQITIIAQGVYPGSGFGSTFSVVNQGTAAARLRVTSSLATGLTLTEHVRRMFLP